MISTAGESKVDANMKLNVFLLERNRVIERVMLIEVDTQSGKWISKRESKQREATFVNY